MEDGQIMIHVRFSPDGSVTEIGERPVGTSAQDWFDRLSGSSGNGCYSTLSGGRAFFRVSRTDVDALKAGIAAVIDKGDPK